MPQIGTFAELVTYPHPYLPLLPETEWRWGWREGESIIAHFQRERSFLIALGERESDVASLLKMGIAVAPDARVTVQRAHAGLIQGERSDWDWMSIYRDDPRIKPTLQIEDLGLTHDDEVVQFLAEASPTASTQPGASEIITWHGLRSDGRLIAVGAASRWQSGAAVLVSIATAPDMRGRGYATEITASLTDALFDQGEHRVTLGLYAGNQPALHAYERVGYHLTERFSSGSAIVL